MIEQQVNMSFFCSVEPDFKTYVYMLLRFDKYAICSGNRYLLDDLYISYSLGLEIYFYLKYKNQYPCKDKKDLMTHIENMRALEKNVFNDSLNLFEKELKQAGYYNCAKLNTHIMKDMFDKQIQAKVTIQKY